VVAFYASIGNQNIKAAVAFACRGSPGFIEFKAGDATNALANHFSAKVGDDPDVDLLTEVGDQYARTCRSNQLSN